MINLLIHAATFLSNTFAYTDLPFRIFLEENRHYRYYMILVFYMAMWLLAVSMRRHMKHLPLVVSVLLVNSILMA